MKVDTEFESVSAVGLSLTFFTGETQTSSSNKITPTIRGAAILQELTLTSMTIKNVIVSQSGIIDDLYYWQFGEFLEEALSYCPQNNFDYRTLTTNQALYVEAMFASIQSQLTPGVLSASPGGIKKLKSPIGSEVELFENQENGSRNYELMTPMAKKVGAFLCGAQDVSFGILLPLFSAFGLRVEEGEKEGINATSVVDVETVPITFF